MHDIRFIRENPDAFDAALKRRSLPVQSAEILKIDTDRRQAQTLAQTAQAKRNELSKQIGEIKNKKGNADELMEEVSRLKSILAGSEEVEKELARKLDKILSSLPNMPADDVPDGIDEKDNKEIRIFGVAKKIEGAQQHFDIGEKLGLMDFETASKLSGARFTMLRGALAKLERALGNFMLDIHTNEFDYTEISPPLFVNNDAMYGTGQLPKFKDDQFFSAAMSWRENRLNEVLAPLNTEVEKRQKPPLVVVNELLEEAETVEQYWLIPTAEVPLTNIVAGKIIDREQLPFRFTAKTPCFRAEAGAAGKDTRGMLRQHQFYKVEMVSITTPDQSEAEHQRMTECAETVLKRLELPFRTIVLCAGDMGFASKKTYDIEVWMPGQNTYREISSCSNCGDFQARRMNARSKAAGEKNNEFVHTLNGSGVAVGRCLIAIMENYQQPDGSIAIPEALQKYMGDLKRIEAGAA